LRAVGIARNFIFPYPLQQCFEEDFWFIQVIKADVLQFFRGYLMIKMHHPITISGHFSQ